MNYKIKAIILICLFFSLGCASNSKSRWLTMGVAASTGAVIGHSTVKDGDSRSAHTVLWSSALTAIAATIGNYYFSDDQDIEDMKAKIKFLKTENMNLTNKPKFNIVDENTGYFVNPLNPKNKKKVRYRIKKGSEWVPDGDGRFYHKDKVIERIDHKEENE